MPRFKKKPVEVEARQWNGEAAEMHRIVAWILENGGKARISADGFASQGPDLIKIDTLEGEMTVLYHDWVIQGVKGEFYPCKPDIFEQTYDEVPSA